MRKRCLSLNLPIMCVKTTFIKIMLDKTKKMCYNNTYIAC